MNIYAKELGEAVKDFDLHNFKRFLLKHVTWEQIAGGLFDHSDEWYKGLMAKIILARTDMPGYAKKKAKEHLDKLGWSYNIGMEGETE